MNLSSFILLSDVVSVFYFLPSKVRAHLLRGLCDVRWKGVSRVWQQVEHFCGKYCNARSDRITNGKNEKAKFKTLVPELRQRTNLCAELRGGYNDWEMIVKSVLCNPATSSHHLQVYCKFGCAMSSGGKVYTGQGCTDKLRFSERKSHEAQCPWSIVPCPNSKECGSLLARDLTEHLISCVHARCKNSL